jgi:cytochrome c-type biogenesis protein
MALAASTLTHAVQDGPFVVAAAVAMLVGLIGFLSPCVLPLVPGYLSYVAGLSGQAATGEPSMSTASQRVASQGGQDSAMSGSVAVASARAVLAQRRMLAGAVLFVFGFSAIFIAEGVFFGSLGAAIRDHTIAIERVLGVVVIVLGLSFMGWIPLLQREFRIHRLPPAGLAGAPLLGAAFGLAWTPCLTPTFSVVYSMSFIQGSAGRGSLLMAFYCLGLGVPFVLVALGFGWVSGALGFVRRHRRTVSRVGGGLLIAIGLLLVTGYWDHFVNWLHDQFGTTNGISV